MTRAPLPVTLLFVVLLAVASHGAVAQAPAAAAPTAVAPTATVALDVDRDVFAPGDLLTIRAFASTTDPLPSAATLELDLPPFLRAESVTRLRAPFAAERPLELVVYAVATGHGAGRVRASVSPHLVHADIALRSGPEAADIDATDAAGAAAASDLHLERTLGHDDLLPGDAAIVHFTLVNPGSERVPYTLHDSHPDWLDVHDTTRFEGSVEPGGSVELSYRATVRFGVLATGTLTATLVTPAGVTVHSATLTRHTVTIDARLDTHDAGASLAITLSNPLVRPVELTLRPSADAGATLDPLPAIVRLEPLERLVLETELRASTTGALGVDVAVLNAGVPAAFPARALVTHQPARRESTIEVPYQIDGHADAILVRHPLPFGSRYVAASSRHGDDAAVEPRTNGTHLFWELPFARDGVLRFTLEHDGDLSLPEPHLTIRAGTTELPLVGDASFSELTASTAVEAVQLAPSEQTGRARRLILAPADGDILRHAAGRVVVDAPLAEQPRVLLNDAPVDAGRLGQATYDERSGRQTLEYYGLPFRPGRNTLEVQAGDATDRIDVWLPGAPTSLSITPEVTVADGATPLLFTVTARDEHGLPSGFGPVAIVSDHEPLDDDAFPLEPGHQLLLRDGVATLRLEPLPHARRIRIHATFHGLAVDLEAYAGGSVETFATHTGSIGVRFGPQGTAAFGEARAYLEAPIESATLQGALDSSGGLAPHARADRPLLTGSGHDDTPALETSDGLAVRLDAPEFGIGYHHAPLAAPAMTGLPAATALHAELRHELLGGDLLTAGAFLGILPSGVVTETIHPDGRRAYPLEHIPQPGSETVVVRTGDAERTLTRGLEYSVDQRSGHEASLVFPHALWPSDERLQRTVVLVTYAPTSAPRATAALGLGVRYENGPWSAALGAAHLETTRYAAEAAFQSADLDARLRVSHDERTSVEASVRAQHGPVRIDGSVTSADMLHANARATLDLGNRNAVALEHQTIAANHTTRALYEHAFRTDVGDVALGAGVGYDWTNAVPTAVLRGRHTTQGSSVELTHDQPFGGSAPTTALKAAVTLLPDLELAGSATVDWTTGLDGNAALQYRHDGITYAVGYRLPGASGTGNRARLAASAPFALDERTSFDVHAGVERALHDGATTAAAGFAVRHRAEALHASATADASLDGGAFRLLLRGSVTGRLDHQQTFGADVTLQFGTDPHARATAAYALRGRDVTLLAHARLDTPLFGAPTGVSRRGDTVTTFEGEAAATFHPSAHWQLRPSFGFRVPFDDVTAATVLAGIGGTAFLTNDLGVAAAVHHAWQPAATTPGHHTAFSIEGTLRVTDPLWLALGYTHVRSDDAPALALPGDGSSARTAGGLYLRFDVIGGRQ